MTVGMLPKTYRGIADLNINIMVDKEQYTEAIDFIRMNETIFPMATERKRLIANLYAKANNNTETINILLNLIKENYENPK